MNEELKKDEINTDAEAEEKVKAEAKEAEEEAEAVDAADAPAEAAEEDETQVLRKLKPKIPDHNDAHPVAENMKIRKDT